MYSLDLVHTKLIPKKLSLIYMGIIIDSNTSVESILEFLPSLTYI